MDPIGRFTWGLNLFAVILLFATAILLIVAFIIHLIKNKGQTKTDHSLKKELVLILPLVSIPLFFFGTKIAIDLIRYPPDEWRWKDNETYIMDEDVIRRVLRVADKGDPDSFAKLFSAVTREQSGFNDEAESFLKAYPGKMSGIKLDHIHDQMLSDRGYRLENGIYVGESFRTYAGFCGDKWYYIYVSYIEYCENEEYLGLNKLIILSEGARIEFKVSGFSHSFDYMLCDVRHPDPDSFRIIMNDAYLWRNTDNDFLTSDQMAAELLKCKDYQDMIDVLGTPNTTKEWELTVEYEYIYETFPEKGEPRYFIVRTSGAKGTVISCSLYGSSSKLIRNVL